MAKPRRERPLKKFPQILVGFLLLIYVLFFGWRAWASLTFPYPIEYGEGAVLYEVSQLAQGHRLYTDNLAPPYQAVVYGPLYYYLNSIFQLITTSFAPGRLISIGAALGAGFCIFRVARTKTGKWTALATAMTPYATEPVYAWGTLFKPDMLATGLSLAAVTLVYLTEPKTQNPKPVATNTQTASLNFKKKATSSYWILCSAALLCVIAFFIKQSAFAAPLAILLFLLKFTFRRAVIFGVTLVGAGLVLGGYFQLTQNQFLTHFVSYNGQPFELGWLVTALNYLLQTYAVLLLLSLLQIIRQWGKQDLWTIYWIIALLVTFSIGKVGSNLNYYLELMFISAVLTWRLLYDWWQQRPNLKLGRVKLPLAAIGFLLLALQLVLLHHIPVVADGANTPGPALTAEARQIETALSEYAPIGPLVVEDAGWLPPLHLTTDLDDSFVFGQLAEGGQWNQERFLQNLANGHYKTVMLQMAGVASTDEAELDRIVAANQYQPFPGRFSPQMLNVLHQHFRVTKRIGTTLFLIWKA